MKTDVLLLWRAIKNATLFARPKTYNGGEVEFSFGDGFVSVSSSDDVVSVVTTVELHHQNQRPNTRLYLPTKAVKQLERQLREEFVGKTKWVELDLAEATLDAYDPEWWKGFEYVMTESPKRAVEITRWDCNPERLSMLSRLEPKGEAALSLLSAKLADLPLWVYRYGQFTMGSIIPLDRHEMKPEYRQWLL